MRRFDPKVLPYIAAMTVAVMLMRAAVDHFGIWGWVIGPLAGLVSSFSLATAGSKISDIAAKRKPLAYISLFGMLVLSPIVIALSERTPDPANWAWALFPDVAILLASTVTGQNLLAKPEASTPQVAQEPGKTRGKKAQVARKTVKQAEFVAFLRANTSATQQQVADHFGIKRQAVSARIISLKKKGIL